MVCCLLCFDDSPLPGPRSTNRNSFHVRMADTPCHAQPYCFLGYLCPCCMAYWARYKTLNGDLSRYTCCQGYLDCGCFRAGNCNEQACPELCLAIESCLCLGPAVSSTRLFLMDMYDLKPDQCDNRLVRFTNCLMCLSCVCDIAAIFVRDARHLAHAIHVVSECAFYSTIGCMVGQILVEIDHRSASAQLYSQVPSTGDGSMYTPPIAVPAADESYYMPKGK